MSKTFTIQADDATFALCVSALCDGYGYQNTTRDDRGTDVPNPESDVQFASRMVLRYLREIVVGYTVRRAGMALDTARTEVEAAMDLAAAGIVTTVV